MMRLVKYLCVLCAALALAACKTRPPEPERELTPPQPRWTQGFPLQQLAEQSVGPGECGLALWTRAQPATRIFFASNTRRYGVINFEGKDVALTARHEDVDLVRGFSQRQLYIGDNLTIALDIQIETRQDVSANAVIRSGVFTMTQASNQKALVLPVVGVIGCS